MRQTLQAYLQAINDHDIETALSYLSDDFTLVFTESGLTMGKEQMADVLGWDSGANGNVTYDELQVSDNTISSVFTEQNDFLKLIGIREMKARVSFEIKDGLIRQQHYEALPNQPSFMEKMQPAVDWAARHRKKVLDEIYPGGQLQFNQKMAKRWVALLRQWRDATDAGL